MFFKPGEEVLVARDGRDVVDHLAGSTRARAARSARRRLRRALAEHTYARRADEADATLRRALARRRAA